MRPRVLILAVALAAMTLGLVTTVALGDESRLRATLTGYEEVPSVSTQARGEFRATIDDDEDVIRYSLTLSGPFNSSLLFAHIHFSQRATNGGVAAFLCGPGGPRTLPACPANGTVEGEIRPADIIGPAAQGMAAMEWAEFVAALRSGVTYANVHSAAPAGQPGGEIRGQINDRNQRNDRSDNDDD